MVFRFTARKAFLTYPQCSLSKEEALQQLQSKHPIKDYCIAREQHEDGHFHLHILLHFERKVNYSDNSCFDIHTFHPNIQTPRSDTHVHNYCHKEDENPLCTIKRKSKWEDVLTCTSANACREKIKDVAPRDYVIFNKSIESYISTTFKQENAYNSEYTTFILPTELMEWKPTGVRKRTLVVLSPAKYGKTEWARSLGCHQYHCGQLNYDLASTDAEYAIFSF